MTDTAEKATDPRAERQQAIAAMREARDDINSQIEKLRAEAKRLSAMIREAEDLEEKDRALDKIARRRGGTETRLKVEPAKIAVTPRKG